MVHIKYPSRICIMVIARRLHHEHDAQRKSGESPERCRHCVRELLQSPLGNREGGAVLTEVRRTALAWNLRSAVHRTCILITIHEYFLNVFWKKSVYMRMCAVARKCGCFYAMGDW